MSFVEIADIYRATDDGLNIIFDLYPQAKECVNIKNKKFAIRNEKTPSASLYRDKKDNIWKVTDFGGEGRALSPVDLVQMVNGLNFADAVKYLADKYRVESSTPAGTKAKYDKRKATAKEKDGEYLFEIKETISSQELSELGTYVSEDTCKRYNVYALTSYTKIKNREAHVYSSNPGYPIFLFDYGDFKKLYKPRDKEKQFRFLWIGKKPADFIGGLDQLKKEVDRLRKKDEKDKEVTAESEFNTYTTTKKPKIKVDSVFICAGEKDSLNVASMGQWVIWLNSETATLTFELYKQLEELSENIYNVPDIDETGLIAGRKMALKFLPIKTLWLPEELREKTDWRGNPCKDVTDFLKHYSPKDFDYLKTRALSLEFWENIL